MSSLTTGPFQNLSATWAQLMQLTPQQMADASAPDYLKIAAMNAQDNIRQQGQPAAGPAAPPVAQQVVDKAVGAPPAGQAMPASPAPAPTQMASHGGYIHDYGVASLPYEANYGHGGIVSFEGGGSTGKGLLSYTGQDFVDSLGAGKSPDVAETEGEGNALVNLAKNNPKTAIAVAGVLGGVTLAALSPVALAAATGVTLYVAKNVIATAIKVGAPRAIAALTGAAGAGYYTNSALNTANTPLPIKTPPGDTREAFMNPDALGVANPDPVDFPAEEPAMADSMPNTPPVYGPSAGGIHSLGNYPKFTPQELPLKYDPIEEDKKQAAANARFGVDPDYAKNELAKNDAKLSALEAQRKGVYSGQGLMDFGAAMASGESSNFLDNVAKAVPAYTGAVKSGNEYARTRADLLDTHGELLRGQEQERNVGRADAALAAQNKSEDARFAGNNANIAEKNKYNTDRFTTMADQQYKTASISAQYAGINAAAWNNYGQLREQIRNNDLQYAAAIETAKANHQSKQELKLLEDDRALHKFIGDAALKAQQAADKASITDPTQKAAYVKDFIDQATSAYTGKRPGDDNLSVEDGTGGTENTGQGLASLGMNVGKAARGLYTSPSTATSGRP